MSEGWYGRPITRDSLKRAVKRCTRPDGTVDKEKLANMVLGWRKKGPGGTGGEFTDVKKITLRGEKTDSKNARKRRKR